MFLRALFEENRRYRWVAAIPLDAVIYHDELSTRRTSLPRFLPEPVMAQIESEANLGRLSPHYRHLVVVLGRDGLARRGCLRSPLRPAPDRQLGLAMPALPCPQDARRAARPLV